MRKCFRNYQIIKCPNSKNVQESNEGELVKKDAEIYQPERGKNLTVFDGCFNVRNKWVEWLIKTWVH